MFKNQLISHLVSNSSSLDEGVEFDSDSQTSSSFSSDLLSSSVTSCYSIQLAAYEANKIENKIVRYRLDYSSASSSASSSSGSNQSSSANSKKHSLPATLAHGRKHRLKSLSNNGSTGSSGSKSNSKNVNDLTLVKHELNHLIKKTMLLNSPVNSPTSVVKTEGLFANLLKNSNTKSVKEETNPNLNDSHHNNGDGNNCTNMMDNSIANKYHNKTLFSMSSGKKNKHDQNAGNGSNHHHHNHHHHHHHHQTSKFANFFRFKKAPLKEKSCSLNSLTDSIDNLKLEKVVYSENSHKMDDSEVVVASTNSTPCTNSKTTYLDHFKNSSYSKFKFYRKYSLKN